jgi:hypothetical protein
MIFTRRLAVGPPIFSARRSLSQKDFFDVGGYCEGHHRAFRCIAIGHHKHKSGARVKGKTSRRRRM